jgi:plasmid stabilization system protein ParE
VRIIRQAISGHRNNWKPIQKTGNPMKVIWSDFAAQALKDIFDYHKEVAGRNIAQKLKAKIFDSTRQFQKYPGSGQVESSLEELGEGHRDIVRGNY